MRFSIRVDDRSGPHVKFALFANGANAGNLVLRKDEFLAFTERMRLTYKIEAYRDSWQTHVDAASSGQQP